MVYSFHEPLDYDAQFVAIYGHESLPHLSSAMASFMSGLPTLGRVRPMDGRFEHKPRDEEIGTTIPGTTLAFTEYTTNVLKRFEDHHTAFHIKMLHRTWIPTLVHAVIPLNISISNIDK